MIVPLGQVLLAAEQPLLREHGVTMWGYSVLLRLGSRPVRSQAALAERIGADKSRLIETLDDLQQRGLISREPDPKDRRVRLLAVTPEGRRLRDQLRRDIQRNERRLLALLPRAERGPFLDALQRLSAAATDVYGEVQP